MYWRKSLLIHALLLCAFGCGAPDDPFSQSEQDDLYGEVESTYVQEVVDYTSDEYTFDSPTPIAELAALVPGVYVNPCSSGQCKDADTESITCNTMTNPSCDGVCVGSSSTTPETCTLPEPDPDDGDTRWFGFAPDDRHSINGDCDGFGTEVQYISELPAVIEGVVTLHPRYLQTVEFCGVDERYYGSYFIEDASGGIMVLKDSRIADFQMGDRVRINVRGMIRNFDQWAVLLNDPEEIVEFGQPIHYEEIDRPLEGTDFGKTLRFTGKVGPGGLPTNQNFNEMCLVRVDDTLDEECAKFCLSNDDCASGNCVYAFSGATNGICERPGGFWLASLDREIGQRQPRIIKEGDVIQITGPIANAFGIKFLVARWGQMIFQE